MSHTKLVYKYIKVQCKACAHWLFIKDRDSILQRERTKLKHIIIILNGSVATPAGPVLARCMSWSQTQTNPSVSHYQYHTILETRYCIAGLFHVRNFRELCVLSQWMKGSESTSASFPGSLLLCLKRVWE